MGNWWKTKVLPERLEKSAAVEVCPIRQILTGTCPVACRRRSSPRQSGTGDIEKCPVCETCRSPWLCGYLYPFCFWQTGFFAILFFLRFVLTIFMARKEISGLSKAGPLCSWRHLHWMVQSQKEQVEREYSLISPASHQDAQSPSHLHHLAVLMTEHGAWQCVQGCSLGLPGLPRAASCAMVFGQSVISALSQ